MATEKIQLNNVMLITPEIAAYMCLYKDKQNGTIPPAIQELSPQQFAAMAKMGILPNNYGSMEDAGDIICDDWDDWPGLMSSSLRIADAFSTDEDGDDEDSARMRMPAGMDETYQADNFRGTIKTSSIIAAPNRINRQITDNDPRENIMYIIPENLIAQTIEAEFRLTLAGILPDNFNYAQHIVDIDGVQDQQLPILPFV